VAENHVASWDLSLDVDCPGCKEWVNLLDYVDFFDGGVIEVCETKKDFDVICPECGHEFVADIEY